MTDDEKFWNEHAEDLRRYAGLSPLTPAEAAEELTKRSHKKALRSEIDAIMDAVKYKQLPERDLAPDSDWSSEYDFAEMDREAALCRNRGDHDPEGDRAEEELFNELLNDDDAEEDVDGVGG
jgi:hypothetical protein